MKTVWRVGCRMLQIIPFVPQLLHDLCIKTVFEDNNVVTCYISNTK